MKISMDFCVWTKTKAALAVAGALAIGGAIGSAVAISPTIAPPIRWAGGVEFNAETFGTEVRRAYTVPAGRSFLLTDLVVMNDAAAAQKFAIYSQPATGVCSTGALTFRLTEAIVPPGNNTILAFQAGIGFGASRVVCIGTTGSLSFHARGFLFTAAPAG